MAAEIDTANHFMVGARADRVVIMALGKELSKEQALNLAAYLVSIADPFGRQFQETLNAVMGA